MNLNTYVDVAIDWASQKIHSNEYPLRCLAFVEDAYEEGNGIEMFGGSSAQESADLYRAEENKSEPSKGALVFYQCSGLVQGEMKNWGHVGLCMGNNLVIHAWDKVRTDHYLEVQDLNPAPGWTKPKFIGWVPVEIILKDHRIKYQDK